MSRPIDWLRLLWTNVPFMALSISCLLASTTTADDRLRIGVWNIEKLSATASRGFPELQGNASLPPRNDNDLDKMAKYIRDELKVDALMVTEIEADSPLSTSTRPQSEQLNQVATKIGSNWKYFLGDTGDDLRLGLLFNSDRVRLKKVINLHAPEFSIAGKDVLDRDPFIAWIAAVDNGTPQSDVILIGVHLKSQQGPYRDNRMGAIAKLVGDFLDAKTRDALTLPSANEEPEAIILGDCNDSSFLNGGFKYMFDYLQGVGFTHIRNQSNTYPPTRVNGSQIDHLFASDRVANGSMISGSFAVHFVPESERASYRKSLSDHFPVTLDLKLRSDDDFTLPEVLATNDNALREQRMEVLKHEAFARAANQFGRTSQSDEDDGKPLKINATIRDKNFDEILAPASIRTTGNAAPASRSLTFTEPANGNPQELSWAGASFDDGSARDTRRSVPTDRYAKSNLPVDFFQQNWTPAESVEFYSLRQGSPLMRRDFFNVLEQPDSSTLFRDSDYLASFGFLPRRPHEGNLEGYPVGFTGDRAIELNCSACHTSKLTYAGKEYRIDGSQAMTDIEHWLHELVRALRLTLDDAPIVIQDQDQFDRLGFNRRLQLNPQTKFGRFVQRLTGSSSSTVTQAKVIYDSLNKDLVRRQRYIDFNDFGKAFHDDTSRSAATSHVRYGRSRLDALGAILNQASAEHLDAPENARRADAPVSYPAIWDAPQHHHVQWNGAVDNTNTLGPLGRNAGQVIGVFGLVDTEDTLVGYDSSINFEAIKRAEELVTQLWSPAWPSDFGSIDATKAASGKSLYKTHCNDCHALIVRDDPRRRVNDQLVPIHEAFRNYGILNTDALVAQNWNDRTAKVGRLHGRLQTLPFQGRFPNDPKGEVFARDILTHMVFNVISRSFVPWRDELTIDDEHARRATTFAVREDADNLMRYKARPLNGVWSTSPYLHNGSVLNMMELLTPPAQRKSHFRVGSTNFEPQSLGFEDAGSFNFDTSLSGNSNLGHSYGTQLDDEQKRQLIEYLKTL